MKKEDLLTAFAEMSPEDQDAVRSEILAKGTSEKTGQACCCTDALYHVVGYATVGQRAGFPGRVDHHEVVTEQLGQLPGEGLELGIGQQAA